MARKAGASTIGANPLDAVVPQGANAQPASPAPAAAPKRAVTVRLSEPLLERLQAAVYWTPGATVTSLLEEGVGQVLDAMEKANGTPFKAAAGAIKTGRRAGT